MSVIVQEQQGEGKIMCYTKGADSIIAPLLKQDMKNQEDLKETDTFLQKYAEEGLRTLLLSQKELSQAEYDDWNKKYLEAASNLQDKEKAIEEVVALLECDLQLIGSTAIEDKL